MNEKQLRARVNKIIKQIKEDADNEQAHCDEDALHQDIIDEFCPEWVKKEVDRLSEEDFTRWYA